MVFRGRILAAWNAMLKCHGGKHVLDVPHAGVMCMMDGLVLEIPLQPLFRLPVANAGISRIRIEKHGKYLLPRLIFHGGRL